ncbi:hypothetical protein FF1_019438 [Malus domestica]
MPGVVQNSLPFGGIACTFHHHKLLWDLEFDFSYVFFVNNFICFSLLQMALPLMPAQAMTQQATRLAHRVYVGGLPPLANEHTIATFFSQVMAAIGGNSVGSHGFYLRAMCFPVFELAGDEGVMKKLYEGVMKELHTLKEREPKVVIKFATSNLG